MNHAKLDIINFGNSEKRDTDLVILCPHDDDGREFLEEYPEIAEACGATRTTLEAYTALERDRGSKELSQAVAEIFTQETHGDFQTRLIVDNLPRAFVDTNRIGKVAIRDVVYKMGNRRLVGRLHADHDAIAREKERIMQPLAYNGGLFLDIHTMAPHNRQNEIGIQPGEANIRAYIQSYLEAKKQGATRRKLDLITDADPLLKVANPELTEKLKEYLTAAGIDWEENKPYTVPMAYGILSSHNMLKYPGIAIDVPKDSMAKKDRNGEIDLLDLKIDHGKVLDTAFPIAQAVIACLKGR